MAIDRMTTPTAVEPAFVRRAALGATGVVLAGALTTASGAWCSPQWKAGWLITGLGVIAGTAVWRRRVRRVPQTERKLRASTVVAFLMAVLVWVGSALFALCLSAWLHGRDLDDTATLKVPALTAECDSTGDRGQKCFYTYVVNGRTYHGTGEHGGSLPVTLRIDPAHPGDLGRADNTYQLLWIAIVLSALVAGSSAWGLADSERGLTRLRSAGAGGQPGSATAPAAGEPRLGPEGVRQG
ncbi:hypothetical protein [Streptomyces rubellomurinus]|uniref:Uncharacterized protein n=2 Tax=Streptomyces TaxID=1883 RepID=A0A0F2TEQ6_STRR3|nr:hypothetical protein [Streptomyces rubellomurinus]KJS60232.1 hypothetical protein VM95_22555 [Streptomyces rubellomurinus]